LNDFGMFGHNSNPSSGTARVICHGGLLARVPERQLSYPHFQAPTLKTDKQEHGQNIDPSTSKPAYIKQI